MATNVYWTNQDARTVMKVPIAGGTPVMLATGATRRAGTLGRRRRRGAVYWNDYDSPGSVMTAPLAGGAPVRWWRRSRTARATSPSRARNVYWINLWILGNNSGAVMTAPLAGGAPVALASAQDDPNGIAVDGANVYWTNLGGTIMKLPMAAARR